MELVVTSLKSSEGHKINLRCCGIITEDGKKEKIRLWHQICIDFRYFSLRPDYTLRFTDQNGQDVTGLVFGCALYYISLFKYFNAKNNTSLCHQWSGVKSTIFCLAM